jgi:hypothetical protein
MKAGNFIMNISLIIIFFKGVFFPACPLNHTSLVRLMVLNASFNNISVISWRSVLLVDETRENHRPVVSHWQTLSHNVVSSTPLRERGLNSQLVNSVWRMV